MTALPHPTRTGKERVLADLRRAYGMTCAPLRYAVVDRSVEQDAALASYSAALLCRCGILAVRRCVVCDDAVCESHSNVIFDSARPRYVSGACDACNESARRTQLARQEAYDRYRSHVEAAARRLLAEEGLARLCDLRAARWSSVAAPRGYRVVDFDAGDSEHGEQVIVVDRRLRFFDWYRGRRFSSDVGYCVSRRGSFMPTDVGALDLARREVLAQGLVARPG